MAQATCASRTPVLASMYGKCAVKMRRLSAASVIEMGMKILTTRPSSTPKYSKMGSSTYFASCGGGRREVTASWRRGVACCHARTRGGISDNGSAETKYVALVAPASARKRRESAKIRAAPAAVAVGVKREIGQRLSAASIIAHQQRPRSQQHAAVAKPKKAWLAKANVCGDERKSSRWHVHRASAAAKSAPRPASKRAQPRASAE